MEIENLGGAVMSSQWTTGSGARFIKRRPVPVYCSELSIETALSETRGRTLKAVKRIRRLHPRCRIVIAVTDRRGLNREVKGATK